MAASAKLIRGHQLAPRPQSTDGDPAFYGSYPPLYRPQSHLELPAANSDGMTSDATCESIETPPSVSCLRLAC